MKLLKSLAAVLTTATMLMSGTSIPSAFSEGEKEKLIIGDVSGNGIFDAFDVSMFQKWLLSMPEAEFSNWKNADFNGDSKLNSFDLALMKKALIDSGKKITMNSSDEGENWKYENGVLTVSDEGGIVKPNSDWNLYKDIVWSIVIESGAEMIAENAFSNFTNLKQVTFPDTLKVISKGAFSECTELLSVTLPEGTEIIERNAFASCRDLGIVCLPESIELIAVNAFSDVDNLKIFGCSEYAEKICDAMKIEYVPYSIKTYGDSIAEYICFNDWKEKIWGDDNGFVSHVSGELELTADNSYITAFCSDIIDDSHIGKDVKILIEAESKDKEILNHIYGGYVVTKPFNDLNYEQGKVISCEEDKGVYKAVIEIDTKLEYTNSFYCQLRLGKNTDSVTGTVKFRSFSMTANTIESYQEFDDSEWHAKRWGDDNGDVQFENGDMIISADDSYITAYSDKICDFTDKDLKIYSSKITVQSEDEELLDHIYFGNVYINEDSEDDTNYYNYSAVSKEKKGDMYEAVFLIEHRLLDEKLFQQIRLGRNDDHVTGKIIVKSIVTEYEKGYNEIKIGNDDDILGITEFIPKTVKDRNFDINNPSDRSYAVSALAMLYRFREGLEETCGHSDEFIGRRFIIYNKESLSYYMCQSVVGKNTVAAYNEYSADSVGNVIDTIRTQAIGFGEYHEMSHSYSNRIFHDKFYHNADDSAVNFRTFISREMSEYSGKLPINDGTLMMYNDIAYEINSSEKNYFICNNTNTMDTYYQFKDNFYEGYIHDLSYDAYRKMYAAFENECEGKGKAVFEEWFHGGVNIEYSSLDSEKQKEITTALKTVLIPGFNDYNEYSKFSFNPQRYLNCVNCLVHASYAYDIKRGNTKYSKKNMTEFLKSDKEIAEAVRKMLYCSTVDEKYEGGSCDSLYKFMNNDELHEFCRDKNYDGYVNEKDKGIILKFEPEQ